MDNKKIFQKVARRIKNDYILKETERCDDHYVGFFKKGLVEQNLWFQKDLRIAHRDQVKITTEQLAEIRKSDEKVMLVILESPHVEEYNEAHKITPAPAVGVTGDMMARHFIDVVSPLVGDEFYHVIVSNAIQYQCSLGVDTNIYRDRVWLDLWLCESFKEEFKTRINDYNPDIIVNLCTRGSHTKDPLAPKGTKTVINQKYIDSLYEDAEKGKAFALSKNTTLKELTQQAINESDVKNKLLLQGAHPSSWYSLRNRRITWVD